MITAAAICLCCASILTVYKAIEHSREEQAIQQVISEAEMYAIEREHIARFGK